MSYRDRDHVNVNAEIGTDPLLEPQQARLEREIGRGRVAEIAVPRDRPQVELATDRLASLASSLLAKMHEIDQKLSPVLSSHHGDDPLCNKAITKVPLAAELDDIGDKIEQALECGKSILDRLEL